VELRYFAGLTGDEAAAAIGVSSASADRMWRYARAWLQVEITGIEPGWGGPSAAMRPSIDGAGPARAVLTQLARYPGRGPKNLTDFVKGFVAPPVS
jgi:hypothetical protein